MLTGSQMRGDLKLYMSSFVVIYTLRGLTIRIISARKANRREVRECERNTVDD